MEFIEWTADIMTDQNPTGRGQIPASVILVEESRRKFLKA